MLVHSFVEDQFRITEFLRLCAFFIRVRTRWQLTFHALVACEQTHDMICYQYKPSELREACGGRL